MNIELISASENDRAFFREAHHLAYRDVVESMFGWNIEIQNNFVDIDFNTRNPHLILLNGVRSGVVGWQEKIDCMWFGPLFILPQYQGRGIGSFLVKSFIDKAHIQRLPLKLQTLRQNDGAKKLYERLGFKVLSADSTYWQMEFAQSSENN